MKKNRTEGECGKKNRVFEAVELLKSNVIDEQAKKIAQLKKECTEATGKQIQMEVLFTEVCKERDWYKKCLESAEGALRYKENIIDKKNCKISAKDDLVNVLRKELKEQCKRREKAENILALVAESLKEFTEKVKKYE